MAEHFSSDRISDITNKARALHASVYRNRGLVGDENIVDGHLEVRSGLGYRELNKEFK